MYGSPYAPPPGPFPPPPMNVAWSSQAYMSGPALVLTKGATLPDVCMKCGARHGLTHRRHTFAWSPPWVWATAVFGLAIVFILMFAMRKTASYSFPICDACNKKWNQGRLFFGLSFLPGLFVMLLSFVFAGIDEPDLFVLTFMASILGFLVAPLVTKFVYSRPKQLWVSNIDDRVAFVRGVDWQTAQVVCQAAQSAASAPAAPAYAPPAQGFGGYGGGGYGGPMPPGGFGGPAPY